MSSKLDGSTGTSRPASVGIQSIEVGMPLIKTLSEANGPMALSTLASSAGMARSKAHKYLTSFVRVGLISQHEAGGQYDLGPLALELGLSAMRRLDVVAMAQDVLNSLRDELDVLVSFAIWANRGPTIVRWAEVPHSTSQTVRLGTVLPILSSPVGHVFAAYLDPKLTQPLIETELAIPNGPATQMGLHTLEDVKAALQSVREKGIAFAKSIIAPGFECLTAPIFNHEANIVATIMVVNTVGRLDTSLDSRAAKSLIKACRNLSQRLGAPE